MINLYEYIAPQEIIVPEQSFKAVPLNLSNRVYTTLDEFINNEAKTAILKKIGEWYKDNSKRRNIQVTTTVSCYLFLDNGEDKLLKDVIDEIRRIGVYGVYGEFDAFDKRPSLVSGQRVTEASIKFSTPTYKQFEENNYKYSYTFNNDCVFKFIESPHTNGYNMLPADDMNVIRRKLYECTNDTTYEIAALPSYSNGLHIPRFIMYLKASFDKNKLKNLLKELKNDRRLQDFADRLESVDRGIRNYYASKKSGDYTGD